MCTSLCIIETGLHRGASARALARDVCMRESLCTGASTSIHTHTHMHARTHILARAGVRVARSYSILAAVHVSRDAFAAR